MAYTEAAGKRKARDAFNELNRIVSGTNWGFAIATDPKGRNLRKWQSIRSRALRESGQSRGGLTGAALEAAVMAIAATDSSLVKIETAGA